MRISRTNKQIMKLLENRVKQTWDYQEQQTKIRKREEHMQYFETYCKTTWKDQEKTLKKNMNI